MTDQYGQVMAGTGRERLVQAVAATSDANGLIAFSLGPCPLGYVWQGSVTVTNAPSGALFNASVATTPWGQWAGPTNFGPVQLWGNETLTVAGVGLQKNTQYSMTFFGVSLPESLADPLPPVAPLSTVSVETTTLLINAFKFTAANAATGITFQPPSLTRRLTFIIDATHIATSCEVDLTGTTSNALYFGVTVQTGASVNPPYFAAVEPNVDLTYKMFMNIAPSGSDSLLVWVLASSTNPMVDNNPAIPLQVQGSGNVLALPVVTEIRKIDSGANWTGVASAPLAITGSPVGPFNNIFASIKAVGANQTLISAPGAGFSLYIQTLNLLTNPAVVSQCDFHAGGGSAISLMSTASTGAVNMAFPGGWELPTNTALQGDIATNTCRLAGTYAIGPTV